MSVEIGLRDKYRHVSNSSKPSRGSGNSGASKVRAPAIKGEKEIAMAVTKANQVVLLLIDGKHRRFVRLDFLG